METQPPTAADPPAEEPVGNEVIAVAAAEDAEEGNAPPQASEVIPEGEVVETPAEVKQACSPSASGLVPVDTCASSDSVVKEWEVVDESEQQLQTCEPPAAAVAEAAAPSLPVQSTPEVTDVQEVGAMEPATSPATVPVEVSSEALEEPAETNIGSSIPSAEVAPKETPEQSEECMDVNNAPAISTEVAAPTETSTVTVATVLTPEVEIKESIVERAPAAVGEIPPNVIIEEAPTKEEASNIAISGVCKETDLPDATTSPVAAAAADSKASPEAVPETEVALAPAVAEAEAPAVAAAAAAAEGEVAAAAAAAEPEESTATAEDCAAAPAAVEALAPEAAADEEAAGVTKVVDPAAAEEAETTTAATVEESAPAAAADEASSKVPSEEALTQEGVAAKAGAEETVAEAEASVAADVGENAGGVKESVEESVAPASQDPPEVVEAPFSPDEEPLPKDAGPGEASNDSAKASELPEEASKQELPAAAVVSPPEETFVAVFPEATPEQLSPLLGGTSPERGVVRTSSQASSSSISLLPAPPKSSLSVGSVLAQKDEVIQVDISAVKPPAPDPELKAEASAAASGIDEDDDVGLLVSGEPDKSSKGADLKRFSSAPDGIDSASESEAGDRPVLAGPSVSRPKQGSPQEPPRPQSAPSSPPRETAPPAAAASIPTYAEKASVAPASSAGMPTPAPASAEQAATSTTGRIAASRGPSAPLIVCRVQAPGNYPGVQYRKSKVRTDRLPYHAENGEAIEGHAERDDLGDLWLCTEKDGELRYLPFAVNGAPVLVQEIAQKTAPASEAESGRPLREEPRIAPAAIPPEQEFLEETAPAVGTSPGTGWNFFCCMAPPQQSSPLASGSPDPPGAQEAPPSNFLARWFQTVC